MSTLRHVGGAGGEQPGEVAKSIELKNTSSIRRKNSTTEPLSRRLLSGSVVEFSLTNMDFRGDVANAARLAAEINERLNLLVPPGRHFYLDHIHLHARGAHVLGDRHPSHHDDEAECCTFFDDGHLFHAEVRSRGDAMASSAYSMAQNTLLTSSLVFPSPFSDADEGLPLRFLYREAIECHCQHHSKEDAEQTSWWRPRMALNHSDVSPL